MLRQSKREINNIPAKSNDGDINAGVAHNPNKNSSSISTAKKERVQRSKSIFGSIPLKKLSKKFTNKNHQILPLLKLGLFFFLFLFVLLFYFYGGGLYATTGSRSSLGGLRFRESLRSAPVEQLLFSKPSPRVVGYLNSGHFYNSSQVLWPNGTKSRHVRKVEYERPDLPSSNDYAHNMKWPYESSDGCIPLHAWQTTTYPSCNTMHEIDTLPTDGNFAFINCGSSRCTFLIEGTDGSKFVLKTQKWRTLFSDYNFEMARIDGISMERLTKSPYIVKIHGLCGASQITEYAGGGNLHDRIKEARLTHTDPIPSIDKLKIGYQIASAVADIHTFEADGVASLVHLDICCHQFVLIDGVYKLGDFHLSSFTSKQKDNGEICLIEPPTMHAKLRSPEEFYAHDHSEEISLTNADVFMMGNVMYYILTNQWLFEGYSNTDASDMIIRGDRSSMPPHIMQSDDRAIKAALHAIEMCWVQDYKTRPTAREVADYIGGELKQIEGVDNLDIVRVKMPPLPKDHKYTDSDFYSNIWN